MYFAFAVNLCLVFTSRGNLALKIIRTKELQKVHILINQNLKLTLTDESRPVSLQINQIYKCSANIRQSEVNLQKT